MRILAIALVLVNLLSAQTYRSRGYGGYGSAITPSLNISLSAGNVYYQNWSSGGKNALWWQGSFDAGLLAKLQNFAWSNTIEAEYGETKLGSDENYKSADKLAASTLGIYALSSVLNPYISGEFYTQFAPGYDYSGDTATQLSDFIDPAYLMESVGAIYNAQDFSFRAGAAAQQVFTQKFNIFSDDTTTPEIEKFRNRFGAEVAAKYNSQFGDYVIVASNFRLFTPFDYVQIWWDNFLGFRFLKYFSVNAELNMRYDPNISKKGQLAQTLSVGLMYRYGG